MYQQNRGREREGDRRTEAEGTRGRRGGERTVRAKVIEESVFHGANLVACFGILAFLLYMLLV